MKTDVIIVGAGPTGLSLACQCVRFGLDFVIVEKNEGVTPFSKAIGVQARTLEIYEQLGLSQSAVEQGVIVHKLRMLEGGEVRAELPLSDIGQGLSAYPFLLMLAQSKNEQLLYDYLRQHGRDVLWQSSVESFTQGADGVTAQIKGADGTVQTVEAPYLVGCDGAKSPVRHALGLSFEGSTQEHLFYVADAQIDWELPHDAVQVCLGHDVLTAFFPLPGDKRYRIVGTFPDGTKNEGEVLYEEIEAQIKKEAKLQLEISDVVWFSTYKVHARRVNSFQSGRCFVAGDAAHIHSPAGAQGMNTGIQDSYNLAWKLAMVIKGHAAPKLLETYNEERLPNAERLLDTTDRAFEVGAGANPVLAFLRTTILPPLLEKLIHFERVRKTIFSTVSQIGISYHDSTLSARHHYGFNVRSGDRMPYFEIENASIYNHLSAAKFHLLTFSTGAVAATIDESFASFVKAKSFPMTALVTEVFGTDKPFQVLLRPDNYIAALAPGETLDVESYLRRLKA